MYLTFNLLRRLSNVFSTKKQEIIIIIAASAAASAFSSSVEEATGPGGGEEESDHFIKGGDEWSFERKPHHTGRKERK